MKKTNWILVTLAFLTAGTITAACGKDGEKTPMPSNQNTKEVTEQTVVVGYSKQETLDINLLIPKEPFLECLEMYLNTEEEGRYIAEDIKVWLEEYGDGKYTPLMSVSYFDLKEEASTTIYINLDKEYENGGMIYTMNGRSNAIVCSGGCSATCVPLKDPNGIVVYCYPCSDVMPANIPIEKMTEWLNTHVCNMRESTLIEDLKIAIYNIMKKFADLLH